MQDFILKYWLEFVFGILATVMTSIAKGFQNKLKQYQDKDKIYDKAFMALLAEDITRLYYDYMQKGYISVSGKKRVYNLFEPYKELGGNGAIASMIEDLDDLPTKKAVTNRVEKAD